MAGRYSILIIFTLSFFALQSCKKVDNTLPMIELIGPALIYHILNEEYIDPGVIVSDDTDENIEAAPDISVNENKTGSYQVLWTAVDEAGNSAQVSRTVIVYNVADTLNGYYDGDCTKPFPLGNVFVLDNEFIFADSLQNNKIWFSTFAAYDSCYVYMIVSDSLTTIPEQTVTIVVDSAVEISFYGFCTVGTNSFDIDFTEAKLNDTLECRTFLVKE